MPNRPTCVPLRQKESFRDTLTPNIIKTVARGYSSEHFIKDVTAGLTVAIVALPLAMGIAIGSGVGPERGLFTAIVAGGVISALGGSRYQIGGPTAAFIVVVYNIVEKHGYEGLALASMLAGLMLVVAGALRLGTYVKYVPYPVTLGFTAGIGLSIFVAQIADLLGLQVQKMPGDFMSKLAVIIEALPTISLATTFLSIVGLAFLIGMQYWRPKWPRLLMVVILCSVLAALFSMNTPTIGSKFGGIPQMLPSPQIPVRFDSFGDALFSIQAVLPDAAVIAFLAGIESLLSAVVADGMTGGRHNSNTELMGQGLANLVSPLFGGICATGAIARTATNIRAGAVSPVSGVLHAVFLLAFMIVAAPLAKYIPLAALSVILVVVAWNMSEAHAVENFLRHSALSDAIVLAATFLLTVLTDITMGIMIGVILAAFKFMHDMANAVELDNHTHDDEARRKMLLPYSVYDLEKQGVVIYRINGPFFFGAASELARLIQDGEPPRLLILDMKGVPVLDSTGATTLRGLISETNKRGARVIVTSVRRNVLRSLVQYGICRPGYNIRTMPTIEQVLVRETLRPGRERHEWDVPERLPALSGGMSQKSFSRYAAAYDRQR